LPIVNTILEAAKRRAKKLFALHKDATYTQRGSGWHIPLKKSLRKKIRLAGDARQGSNERESVFIDYQILQEYPIPHQFHKLYHQQYHKELLLKL
jgi:hypothetical protein